jgi:EF hand
MHIAALQKRARTTKTSTVLQAMGFSILLLMGCTYVSHVSAQAATDSGQPKPAVSAEKPPGHGMRHQRGEQMMSRMDTDKDGSISRAELQAAHLKQLEMFDRADANKDGKLSAEERKAFYETMRAENRAKRG